MHIEPENALQRSLTLAFEWHSGAYRLERTITSEAFLSSSLFSSPFLSDRLSVNQSARREASMSIALEDSIDSGGGRRADFRSSYGLGATRWTRIAKMDHSRASLKPLCRTAHKRGDKITKPCGPGPRASRDSTRLDSRQTQNSGRRDGSGAVSCRLHCSALLSL